MGLTWKPDYLGGGFTCAELDLGSDDEGPCVATLVSYSTPATPPRPVRFRGARDTLRSIRRWTLARVERPRAERGHATAVLYLHGWSDYFLHRGLAGFCAGQGIEFYALDLRKYGRSLRSWQTPGYVADLAEYDDDINGALTALTDHVREKNGTAVQVDVHIMAHSTGALVASLWANRFPGRIAGLILNSPWLDVQGSSILRTTTQGLLEPITRFRPKARLKLPEFGFYWRSISNTGDGEWEIHPQWRPQFGFPIRAGWLTAILAGHAQVRKGLEISVPVLVLASAKSSVGPVWNDAMLESDSVLDVTLMTQLALQLGPTVTVCRFDGALHDVLLSREPVRAKVYEALGAWFGCHGATAG